MSKEDIEQEVNGLENKSGEDEELDLVEDLEEEEVDESKEESGESSKEESEGESNKESVEKLEDGGEDEEAAKLDKLDKEEEDLNKTFTQKELKGILKSRLARERKSFDNEVDKLVSEKVKEKKRVDSLSEDELKQEELTEKEKTLKQREQELDFRERFSEAESELRARGLHTPFARYVVNEDGDKTKENIEEFQSLYNRSVQEGIKEALKGETPSGNKRNRNEGVTVNDYDEMSYSERVDLKRKDNKLFNKLSTLSKKRN